MTKKNRQPELIPSTEAPPAPAPLPDPPMPEAAGSKAPEQAQPQTALEVKPSGDQDAMVAPASGSDALLQMAIDKNLDIEKLKMLIDLRNQEEARRAERLFEFHFAEMQKEYIPVYKTKDGAKKAWKYCPLPNILVVYAPIISKHGFSFWWDEEEVEGAAKTITFFLSGYGHTRKATITLPYSDRNDMINVIQARAITTEYGRRYTFKNLTGCIVADEEDTDGDLPPMNPELVKKHISLLLQFAPKGMRTALADRLKTAKTEDLEKLMGEVEALKERRQQALKKIEKRVTDPKAAAEARTKAISGLETVNNLDEFVDWEAFCENL